MTAGGFIFGNLLRYSAAFDFRWPVFLRPVCALCARQAAFSEENRPMSRLTARAPPDKIHTLPVGKQKGDRTVTQRLIDILVDSFWKILLPGLTVTIPLTVIAFCFAMVIATVTALIQFAHVRALTPLMRFYIWVIRGTPLLVQLYVVFFGLPKVGILIEPFPAAVLVFSINEGAYCAETIRAALESVPAGQLEAGYCVGLTWWQTMQRIVLPQAMRTAFPSLSNSLISMVKDTSLAANITVTEMFMATQRINARVYEPLALYIEVGLIYLLFCTLLTRLQRWGEKKLDFTSFREVKTDA